MRCLPSLPAMAAVEVEILSHVETGKVRALKIAHRTRGSPRAKGSLLAHTTEIFQAFWSGKLMETVNRSDKSCIDFTEVYMDILALAP